MRIGIDATALPMRPVGAGNYIIQLIRSLADIAHKDELVIFIQRSRISLLDIRETSSLRFVPVGDMPVPVRLVWEQTALPALAKREKLDLLHSPHYTTPLLLSCKNVVTFHDMTFFLYPHLHTPVKRALFPLLMRFSARRSDLIITDSENARQDAIRILNIPEHKVKTVQLGVTSDFRQISDPIQLERVRNYYQLPNQFMLYVGTLEPRKNVILLLNVFETLAERYPDWRLVVVGQVGWMVKNVRDKLDKLEREKRVIQTGYVPKQDLITIYNLADVLVYPSLYEGFGLPVLEGMACGTPVVTTNVSSMPEILGDAGILVSPGDENELAGALAELLSNPKRRQQYAEKGLQRAATFTWEAVAHQTWKIYQQVTALG